jgi:hypothetical protein
MPRAIDVAAKALHAPALIEAQSAAERVPTNGLAKMAKTSRQKSEPNTRDRLSHAFIAALEGQWKDHGEAVLDRLREESPKAFAELVVRLVPPEIPQNNGPYTDDMSSREIATVVLTEKMGRHPNDTEIDLAIIAMDNFTHRLDEIAGGKGSRWH